MSKREKAKKSKSETPSEPDASEQKAAQGGASDEAEQASGETADEDPELTPEEQLGEMTDRWMRTRAETENVRRRARLDVEEARKHGSSSLIKSLLPVLDSLQRALESKPAAEDGQNAEDEKVWEGLEMTAQILVAALGANGVTPIDAGPGTPFDPSAHQALLQQPTNEQEPGTIVVELVRGYRLHDRLLRESQVTVATKPVADADGSPDGQQPPTPEDAPNADV